MKDTNVMQSVLQGYMKRGSDLIYKQRLPQWESLFKYNKYGNFAYLTTVVEIMELLEKDNNIEKAIRITNERNYSQKAFCKTLNTITVFSKKGIEYFKAIYSGPLTEEVEDYLEELEDENSKFEDNEIEKNVQLKFEDCIQLY